MTEKLIDRVCVVTGATGMAAATARRLAAEGAQPFVVSLEEADCERLAREITDSGGICRWAAAELGDEKATVAAFARCEEELGTVDGLVAVAGAGGRRHGDGPALWVDRPVLLV